MKYRIEHEFPVDRETLIRTMYGEGVSEKLLPSMKTVREIESLSREEKGGRVSRRVRYRLVPIIESIGPKKVNPEWMEWIEESEVDLAAGRATYRNIPTTPGIAKLLKNGGEMTFESLGPSRTRRILTGELKVDVFVLGSIAERVIFSHAKALLDEEAEALRKYMAGGGR